MSTKLKLLFITDWFEPAFKGGGPIRSIVNLTEHLKQDYHCYIYTSYFDFGDKQPLKGVISDQWNSQNGIEVYYRSGKMTFAKIKEIIKEINPDRIYLNSMFSSMIKPILAAYASQKIIIAPRGMLNPSALAVKPIKKFFYLWLLRTFGFAKYLKFHAISNEEEKVINRIFPNAQAIIVAGNIPAAIPEHLHIIEKQAGILKMVFVGRMHPIKNLHLLIEALKNVKGQLLLSIIATNEDQNYLEKCKEMAGELPNNIQINWLLDVPHIEIKQHLLDAHLFALLSQVESFGHAIFEAFAVGCPVLISDNTPWKMLKAQKAGVDVSLHNLEQITSEIQFFLHMDNQEWQLYREGAHRLAIAYTGNLDVYKLYRPLFEN